MKSILPVKLTIILSFLAFSCGSRYEEKAEQPPPVYMLSSEIISTRYEGTEYPSCFEAAFQDSTLVREITTKDTSEFFFSVTNLGKIKTESGKIIACDPIFMFDGIPFLDTFPKGEFPVQLAIADIPNNNRVAFSRILFSDEPIAKWSCALQRGDKPSALNDSTFCSFSVDGGMAIYIDSAANAAFNSKGHTEWMKAFSGKKWYQPDFFGHMYDFDNSNVAAFNTGYGDGCYPTYIGLDKNGRICRLVSDFGFVMWWRKPSGS